MIKLLQYVFNIIYIELSLAGIFVMAVCLQVGMPLGISMLIGIVPMAVLWRLYKKEGYGILIQLIMSVILTFCTYDKVVSFLCRTLWLSRSFWVTAISLVITFIFWYRFHETARKDHVGLDDIQQAIKEEKQREKMRRKSDREYKKEQKKAEKERKEHQKQEKKRKNAEEKIRREDEQRRRQEQENFKSKENGSNAGKEKGTESSQKNTNSSYQKSSQSSSGGSYQKSSQGSSSGRTAQRTTSSQFDFFAGCRTLDELKSRYKKLASVYHPDNATGNEEIFKNISAEFEKKKKVMA